MQFHRISIFIVLTLLLSLSSMAAFQFKISNFNSMDAMAKFFMGLLFLATGLLLFYGGFYYLKTIRVSEDTPLSTVRAIAMGRVIVRGKIIPRTTFKSWLSNRDCVYCKVTVTAVDNPTLPLFYKLQGEHFYVQDSTGKVLVDPNVPLFEPIPYFVHCAISYQEYAGLSKPFSPNVTNFLNENKASLDLAKLFSKGLLLTEWVLEPGQTVSVVGMAIDNPDVPIGEAHTSTENVLIQFQQGQPFQITAVTQSLFDNFKNWKLAVAIGVLFTAIGLYLLFI